MRTPIDKVHVELVGICSDVTGLQAIVFKAFVANVARPDKNEDNADHKKNIRHVGLFKGDLKHLLLRGMIIRGGKLIPWIVRPAPDPSFGPADHGRAATLEARFAALGVREEERRRLVPCAVLRARWPETRYPAEVEARLAELRVES